MSESIEKNIFDVIIVGTGAAGLFSALKLSEDKRIVMITKDKLENSDSYLAQGGISVLRQENDYDSYFEDTMKAGHYENNKESVEVMINSSRNIISQLMEYGVEFDKNEDGTFAYTREGAHSTFRILRHDDLTGKEITTKLIHQVKNRNNITIKEYCTMVDLLVREKRSKRICSGIVVSDRQGGVHRLYAKQVILATGGIGGIFRNSTNFPHITGDSFAIAMKHNIILQDLHYIQIHPTALYSTKPERRFLISESLRGEGGILINAKKERFVNELLPRDIVAAAISEQMEKEGTDHVYLDMSHLDSEKIKTRFPNIYKQCLEEGYDMTKEPIPVAPAQHYLMGGIKTDTYGKTSLDSLYAVGETACNGVHGANRLASNSLLESLVFAERAADSINHTISSIADNGLLDSANTLEHEIRESVKQREEREKTYRKMIYDAIEMEDEKFYVKWCNNAS